MDFSYTDLTTFHRCRFQYVAKKVWDWEHKPSAPMLLGTLVHAGLNAHHWKVDVHSQIMMTGDEQYQNSTDIELETLKNLEKLSYRLTYKALDQLADFEVITDQHGIPMSEYKIIYPLNKEDNFIAVLDLVCREKSTGMLWLIDYKVRETIQAPDTEDYNLQMAIYQWLLQQRGIPVVGSIMFQIRSTEMKAPKLNKDGSLSRADVICDWEFYKETILYHGLNPDDYLDMKTKLADKKFFALSKDYRNAAYLNNIWSQVVEPTIRDIKYTVQMSQAITPIRNLNSMCKSCSIAERCLRHLQGLTDPMDTSFEEEIENARITHDL